MTRSNSVYLLRRVYENTVSSLGALAVTTLLVASVNAQAASPSKEAAATVTPSVTILVPSVTIEPVEG
jgi:hypothetical protein